MGIVSNINVFKNDPSPTVGAGLRTLRANQVAFRELIGALPPSTVTALEDNYSIPVNSASIILNVPSGSEIRFIQTQSNLSGVSNVDAEELHDGMVIKLWGVTDRVITLKHKGDNSVANYNIKSIDNADIVLSHTIPTILTYDANNNVWVERERTAAILNDSVGDKSQLTTTHRNNLVEAINEVKENTSENATNISTVSNKVGTGSISSYITNTNVVAALNNLVSKIGLPLSSLNNSLTKTSLITAINSLVTLKANATDVGTLSNLTTTEKGSIVGAINEIVSNTGTSVGDLTTLATTNKSSIVSAINEIYGTSGVVHKSGDENIGGNKVFTSSITAMPNIVLKNTSVDHTNKPSTDKYEGLYFTDTNNVTMSRVMFYKNANGTSGLTLGVKAHNTDSYIAGLGFYVPESGDVVTTTVTPSLDDAGTTKIATTKWVRTATGDFACNAATATTATTATNVTGTVAIANGGTGATTRLNAIKALTNENVSTNTTHFLGLKSDWSKVGYVSLADTKSVLGINATSGTSTLAWNTEVTLATVNGLAVKAKLPANPDTNDHKVRQDVGTTNKNRPILSRYNIDDATQTANYVVYDTGVTNNPSTHTLSASGGFYNLDCADTDKGFVIGYDGTAKLCLGMGSGHVNRGLYDKGLSKWLIYANDTECVVNGNLTGNADTATQFSANKSVALTGDVTGSASSKAGWSVATTLSNSGVTAGNYGPSANASPSHGSSFSVPYITVDAKGRVTAASTKTITLPSDNNTDTLVTQNKSTTNATYPILMTPTADATSNQGAKTSIFATGVKINPSTNVLSASGGFSGNLTGNVTGNVTGNADTATKATQDANGNTISSTYLKLSGGTMTGSITRNGALGLSGNTSGSIYIANGSGASDGGGIWMYGKDHSNAGKVRLQAYNGTYYYFDVSSDGTSKTNTTLTATGGFSGNLTGNATTATKATQDSNGRNISTGYMWRGSYERIEGTSDTHKDLNGYTTAGFYNVITTYVDNCPSGIGNNAVLLVYPWMRNNTNIANDASQEITEAASSSNLRRWIRKQSGGTWSNWVQIARTDSDITGNAATATKATQDVDGNAIKTTYAKLASPTFTGTPKAPTASTGTNTTQIATTAFVSTAITNATTLGTASRALVTDSNKKIAVSSVTSTELGYLSGVTSAIQTQINAKAADNAVVHLSGAETITGEKTCSSAFNVAAQHPVLRLQSTTLDTKTTSSAAQIMHAISFNDKNGTDTKYRTGHIRSGMTSNDCTFIHMQAVNPTTDSTASAGIGVYYSRDGKTKAVAPSTYLSSDVTNSTLDIDGTDIVTRDFIPKDTRIVHTTGTETISGDKTFNDSFYMNVSGEMPIYISNTNFAKGDTLTTNRYSYIRFGGSTKPTSNSTSLGLMGVNTGTTYNKINLFVFKNASSSSDYAGLSVFYPNTGSPYATAPSTPATGNSTDIITRGYLDTHKVEKTAWSSTKLRDTTLSESVTATSTNPYTITAAGNDGFGEGYKELLIRLIHTTAQQTAATLRYKITFSDNKIITGQSGNGISTSANNYVTIKAVNDNGLYFTEVCRSAGSPSSGTWYSLNGASGTYMPTIGSYDATITSIDIWSITTAVTALPSGFHIIIYGRK